MFSFSFFLAFYSRLSSVLGGRWRRSDRTGLEMLASSKDLILDQLANTGILNEKQNLESRIPLKEKKKTWQSAKQTTGFS